MKYPTIQLNAFFDKKAYIQMIINSLDKPVAKSAFLKIPVRIHGYRTLIAIWTLVSKIKYLPVKIKIVVAKGISNDNWDYLYRNYDLRFKTQMFYY